MIVRYQLPRSIGFIVRCAVVSLLLVAVGQTPSACGAADLKSRLMPLIKAHQGTVAVAVKDLETGAAFAYRDDEPMPTASLIKFPVMVAAYRQADAGNLDLDKPITLNQDDKVPGSGILTPHFSAGIQIPLRDAIRLMIVYSDNTATNLVIDQIGLDATARTMEQLGLPNTKLHSKVFRRDTSIFPERSKQFGLGSTTAAEMVQLYERLQQGKLLSTEASKATLDHLKCCSDRTKLARLLPPGTEVAHKGGSVSATRCDAGIIFSPAGPIAVCVMTSGNKDRSWDDDNAGNRLCAEIGRATYDHFNPPGTTTAIAPTELKSGASGQLVETLQRTLNARLSPSPELGIDGDFGPMTEATVVRFQKENNLVANGEVGPETWKALEPLVTEGPPVPAPAVVNNEQLPMRPADRLAGPPLVSCKAWAVGDGKTGKLLWGSNEERPLDFASTTKIMTAYVVVKVAEKQPEVLDEILVFSERADQTEGSTAGVRAGEKVPVRELLYGLLLPSGNDASVALAEHFGSRFEPPDGTDTPDDPLVRFVAEMNRAAETLGMRQTRYLNTHGLTAVGHLASCGDLLRLSFAALECPLFAQTVRTRQRGCTVTGPSGYRRNVLWKNTNRLLPITGFLGVKTGTTNAAGACLVSTGYRGDDRLIVVVLGATSSDARYIDSRNLYRWAWTQRGHRDQAPRTDADEKVTADKRG